MKIRWIRFSNSRNSPRWSSSSCDSSIAMAVEGYVLAVKHRRNGEHLSVLKYPDDHLFTRLKEMDHFYPARYHDRQKQSFVALGKDLFIFTKDTPVSAGCEDVG